MLVAQSCNRSSCHSFQHILNALCNTPSLSHITTSCFKQQNAKPEDDRHGQRAHEVQQVIEEFKSTPGWLKGPLGKYLVRALGEEEWKEVKDNKNQTCWTNTRTGETTGANTPKPDTWEQVIDRRTGLIYYWNRRTGEATEIGEARPGMYGRAKPATSSESELSAFGKKANTKPGAFQALQELLKGPFGFIVGGVSVLAIVVQLYDRMFSS